MRGSLLYILMIPAIAATIRSTDQLKRLWTTMLVAGGAACTVGILSSYVGGIFESTRSLLPGSDAVRLSQVAQATGFLTFIMAFVSLVCLELSRISRLLLYLVGAVAILFLGLSGARTYFIALVFGIAILCALNAVIGRKVVRREYIRRSAQVILIVCAITVSLVLLQAELSDVSVIDFMVTRFSEPVEVSLGERGFESRVMWQGALETPVLGRGYGNPIGFGGSGRVAVVSGTVIFGHNEYLWLFMTMGLVGLLAFACFFGWFFVSGALMLKRDPGAVEMLYACTLLAVVAGYALAALSVSPFVRVSSPPVLAIALAGVVVIRNLRSQPEPREG
jgi:O-antigen ligase